MLYPGQTGYLVVPAKDRKECLNEDEGGGTVGRIGVPLLGRLPLDPQLALRCDAGEIEDYPAEHFSAIAKHIVARGSTRPITPLFRV